MKRYRWDTINNRFYFNVFFSKLFLFIRRNGLAVFIKKLKVNLREIERETFGFCIYKDILGRSCGVVRYQNQWGTEFPKTFKPNKYFLESHYRNLKRTMGEERFKKFMEWSERSDRSIDDLDEILGPGI